MRVRLRDGDKFCSRIFLDKSVGFPSPSLRADTSLLHSKPRRNKSAPCGKTILKVSCGSSSTTSSGIFWVTCACGGCGVSRVRFDVSVGSSDVCLRLFFADVCDVDVLEDVCDVDVFEDVCDVDVFFCVVVVLDVTQDLVALSFPGPN